MRTYSTSFAPRGNLLKPIIIQAIHLHPIALPFVEVLRTSFGQDPFKAAVLVEVVTENGISGWGEISVEVEPGYGAETVGTSQHIAKNFLLPKLVGQTIDNMYNVPKLMAHTRGNNHTKHGIEAAIWDALAQANDMRLADLFASYLPEGHASRGKAVVGVSIGIQPTIEATIAIIQKRLNQGYRRIKLKIQPGWDVEVVRAVRSLVGVDVMLQVDANASYTLDHAEDLARLDEFGLACIEQPLGWDQLLEHAELQRKIATPICLDESLRSFDDVRRALDIDACRNVNLKPARVGGITESLRIAALCAERGVPLWCGGMMESGIGRASNLALCSLPAFTDPADMSPASVLFESDLVDPTYDVSPDGTIAVPSQPGLGFTVAMDRVEARTVQRATVAN